MPRTFTFLLPIAVAAPLAAAQTAPEYRSAFENYQRFEDAPVQDWPRANATVGRIGGWRAYAREAQEAAPEPRAPAQPAQPAQPARPGHDHGQPSPPGPAAPPAAQDHHHHHGEPRKP